MLCAEKAFQYGRKDMAGPEKLYYYIQKYLLTGDKKAHDIVKEMYTITDSLKYHLFRTQGYSLNDVHFDNPAYFYSYIVEKDMPTDQKIVDFFLSVLKAAADSNIAMLYLHAYPVGNNSRQDAGWGHNVKQPKYASIPLLYLSISREQSYFDAASELMSNKVGLNPIGISYLTGTGFHRVHNPHDRESAYHEKTGLGQKPGVTIFGPGVTGWWRKSPVLPHLSELAPERRFVDDLKAINFTEFTIFETQAYEALYTVIAGGGKWNGTEPFSVIKDK
jgi:endoglucanase